MSSSFRLPSMVPLLLLLLVQPLLLAAVSDAHSDSKTVELVNFEFENRVPPHNTVVVSATPSGNLSQSEFGTLRVVTNVLRERQSRDSPVLGSVVGVVNSLLDGSFFLAFNFVYDTSAWEGTLAVQGRLDAGGNGELVISGGTGDFRLAQGWCETTLVEGDDPANIVFKNVVHLKL